MAAVPEIGAIPGALNLRLQRGDDITLELTLTDENEDPLVVPTSDWTCTIKDAIGGTIITLPTVDATDGASGVLVVSITGSETADAVAKGVWDLQCTDGGVRTYLSGKVVFVGEVTEADD